MDAYCQKNLDRPFDKNGAVASKGIVLEKELERLMSLKFFSYPFPKSTGKELFNYELIGKPLLSESPKDILATLTELTALSIQVAVQKNNFLPNDIVICGGGVKNKFLLERISKLLDANVTSAEDEGLNSQAIESMAFAWFGFRRLNNIQSTVQISNKIVKKALLGSLTSSK
jgi:anhydro-N-acetylmuramic acid kinase